MSLFTTTSYNTFTPGTIADANAVNSNTSSTVDNLNSLVALFSTAASHTLTQSDGIRNLSINVNTSAGYTVTLPTATASGSRALTIVNIGQTTGSLTIDGAASETINGQLTRILRGPYSTINLINDGTNWLETQPRTGGNTGTASGVTWSATNAPSGTSSEFYQWEQIGNAVNLNWRLEYSVAAAGATDVSFNFDSTMPTPRLPAGAGSLEWAYHGDGDVRTSAGGGLYPGVAAIYYSSTAFQIFTANYDSNSVNAKIAFGSISYMTDE